MGRATSMRSVLHASPLRAAVHLTKCTLHSAASVPPVTLLSGFLGTGKTTALTKILDSRAELNLAVIVNDVATVNVEAASMKAQPVSTGTKPVELIELSNGCGSKAGELASSIELLFELGARREAPFDHVIVEIPGVADPAAVRGYLEQAGIPVTRVLTFIDTPSITDQWMTMDFLEKCTEGEDPHTAQKRVVSLLTAQIEAADVIALNKIDLATDQQICNATRICTALTATQSEIREPTILTTRFGVAPLKDMLPQLALVSSCEDSKPNIDSTTCQTCQGLMTKDTTMDALGIHSFVFSSDRPFDDLRLFCLVHHWPMFRTAEKALEKRGGVLRSKGTICVRSDFHTM